MSTASKNKELDINKNGYARYFIFLFLSAFTILLVARWLPLVLNKSVDNSIYDTADWWGAGKSWRILEMLNTVRGPFFQGIIDKRINESDSEFLMVDIGCGGGLLTEYIAKVNDNKKKMKILGLDPSMNSIVQAGDHSKKLDLQTIDLVYEVGYAEKTGVDSETVDFVIMSDVLEHLVNMEDALEEVERILKPGGVFLFDTINRTPYSLIATYLLAQEVFEIIPKGAHSWMMFIKPQELEASLIRRGFVVNSKEWIGIWQRDTIKNVLGFIKRMILKNEENTPSRFFESGFQQSDYMWGSYAGYATKK